MNKDSANPTIARGKMVEGVQMLRFVAAFMVVATHTTFYLNSRISSDVEIWHAGVQGVNLFFVISGFVMMLTAGHLVGQPNAFRRFMLSRIIRIVPLYWLLNFLKILQILIMPSLAFASPTVSNVVLSLFFIPSRNAEGAIETFYGVGWTLNFEMAFYLIVALCILWRLSIVAMVATLLLAAAGLSVIRTDAWPAFTFLLHPIVLNFLWGVLIAKWYLRGGTVHPSVAVTALVVGMIVILGWPDLFVLEFEYALVVAGVVALEPRLAGRLPRWLLFGGDASYSLYLVHPTAGVLVAILLSRLGLHDPIFAGIIIVGFCLASSALTYLFVERPFTVSLRNRFLSSRVSGAGVSDAAVPEEQSL